MSTTAPVKIGIIGTGMMGLEHIRNLQAIEGAEIVAIADPHPDSLEWARMTLGEEVVVPSFADHRELLAAGLCDAVVIASPNMTHAEVLLDDAHELGVDPGLVKDGVEAQLQELLAAQVELLGEGWRLVRREYPTAIGPVDLMCRDADGVAVAVEIKRRGEIDGVEQLTRYLELLNRDPLLAPVSGIFAAQEIKPQARTLAEDRGIRCVVLDYDQLRGVDDVESRLF